MVDNDQAMTLILESHEPSPPFVVTTHAHAFDEVRPELETIPDDELRIINLDVVHAAEIVLGASGRIERLLPALARLPDVDMGRIERLRLYAGALLHTHLLTKDPVEPDPRLRRMLAEASMLRADLLVVAEALGHLGLLSAVRVAEIRSGQGHRDTANDLCALATLYDAAWAELRSKVPISRIMVDRAAVLGAELHGALGERRLPADPHEPSDDDPRQLRVRAFTAMIRAYDVCRRGVIFLRWDLGDADRFVPTLYSRRRRRSPLVDEENGEAAEPTPSSPMVSRPSTVVTLTAF